MKRRRHLVADRAARSDHAQLRGHDPASPPIGRSTADSDTADRPTFRSGEELGVIIAAQYERSAI